MNENIHRNSLRRFLEKTIPAARWLSEAEASSKRSQVMSLQVDFFEGSTLNKNPQTQTKIPRLAKV
jgi:hypothetical protein